MKTISTTRQKWKQITVKQVGLAGLKKELAGFEKNMACPPRHFCKKFTVDTQIIPKIYTPEHGKIEGKIILCRLLLRRQMAGHASFGADVFEFALRDEQRGKLQQNNAGEKDGSKFHDDILTFVNMMVNKWFQKSNHFIV